MQIEPILVEIASANRVVHVIGEQVGIDQIHAIVEIVIALHIFRSVAIGDADFPDLLTMTNGLPIKLAQIQRLTRLDSDVGLGVFTEYARCKGV